MSEVKTDSVVNVSGDNDSGIDLSTNDVVAIKTADTERARVASDGKVGIGTTSPAKDLHVSGGTDTRIRTEESGGSMIDLTVTNSGHFIDSTSTGDLTVNKIGSANMILKTNNTERMRIESGGDVLFGKTASGIDTPGMIFDDEGSNNFSLAITSSNDPVLFINRQTADGTLVQFRHANTTEGSITVSGTTVSYNGGHLSRWSRLLDGSRPDTLLKGTVLSNLDDMIVWTGEENEQLNHTKISDTEGDANVAGVFVAWDDDDDDYEDFYLAMTGDFIIRIAQGTTVARGDLLMSAGDGTAKPQDDDIVRSKTIAKVTSTTVSHTYDDGSYLVPCVLMAC